MRILQILRKLLWVCFAGLVLLAINVGWLVLGGLRDELTPSDVAVVLGNRVELNGQPSRRLQARLDRAVELYRAGTVPYIITSGGLGIEGFDEAVVMKDYLVKAGIPADRIIADSFGINTAATARNTAAIMQERGWNSATAVSQYFHIQRCKLAFSQAGIAPVYGAHARFFEAMDIPSTLREVVGYWVYLVRDS